MVLPEKSSKPPKRSSRQRSPQHQRLPSPALCCACGLCIMLTGINITLVGAFSFGTFIPTSNVLPIIIGPILLFVALAFFIACCVISRRLPANTARGAKGGKKWGLMRMRTAMLEMEMSEHTPPQDTTAVQLSPNDSPASSHRSSSSQGAAAPTAGCQPGAGVLHTPGVFDVGATGDNPTMTSDLRETAQNLSSA